MRTIKTASKEVPVFHNDVFELFKWTRKPGPNISLVVYVFWYILQHFIIPHLKLPLEKHNCSNNLLLF